MAPKHNNIYRLSDPLIQELILVEPYVDLSVLDKENGIIGRALTQAQLCTFVSNKNTFIYPVPVVEFFGNLNEANKTTSISFCPDPQNPHHRQTTQINLRDVTNILGLRSEGASVADAGHQNVNINLRRFTGGEKKRMISGIQSKEMCSPFKRMCDFVTKVLLSHNGSHANITKMKLSVLCALVDELTEVKYNWADFIISQWIETKKDVVREGPFSFKIGSHIRFGNVITAALLKLEATMQTVLIDRSFSFRPKVKPTLYREDEVKLEAKLILKPKEDISDEETAAHKKKAVKRPLDKGAPARIEKKKARKTAVTLPTAKQLADISVSAKKKGDKEEEEADTESDTESDVESRRKRKGDMANSKSEKEETEGGDETNRVLDQLSNIQDPESTIISDVLQDVRKIILSSDDGIEQPQEKEAEKTTAQSEQAPESTVHLESTAHPESIVHPESTAHSESIAHPEEPAQIADKSVADVDAEKDTEDEWDLLLQSSNIDFPLINEQNEEYQSFVKGLDEIELLDSNTDKRILELESNQASTEIDNRFNCCSPTDEERTSLHELLMYTRLRGTELYRLFQAEDVFGREKMIEDEARIQDQFKINGFHEFIDEGAAWEKMENFLAQNRSNLREKLGDRSLSINELSSFIDELNKELNSVEEQLKLSQRVTATTEEEMRVLIASHKKIQEDLLQLQEADTAEIEKLKKRVDELERSLRNAQKELKEKIAEASEKVIQAEEKSAQATAEKNEVVTAAATWQADKQALLEKLAATEKENAELKKEVSHLSDELIAGLDKQGAYSPYFKSLLDQMVKERAPQYAHSILGVLLLKLEKAADAMVKGVRVSGTIPSSAVSKGEETTTAAPRALAKSISINEPQQSTSKDADRLTEPRQLSQDKGKAKIQFSKAKLADQALVSHALQFIQATIQPSTQPESLKTPSAEKRHAPAHSSEDISASKRIKTAGRAKETPATLKENSNDALTLRTNGLFKNFCISYAPQNKEEKKALYLYAQRIVAAEMKEETEKYEKDEATRKLKVALIEECKLKMDESKAQKLLTLKETVFTREAPEILKFLEVIKAKPASEYVPKEYQNDWMKTEETFIKMHYFWVAFKTTSPQLAFVRFMESRAKGLWAHMLKNADNELMLAPEKRILHAPRVKGYHSGDKKKLDDEWLYACELCNADSDPSLAARMKIRVYSAYGIPLPGNTARIDPLKALDKIRKNRSKQA